VVGQLFDSSGAALGGEFQVNTYTTNVQAAQVIAIDGDGDFVVAWESIGQDGSGSGVFGQRYDSAGTALGAEFQVNTYTTNTQGYPALAADADGNLWSCGPVSGARTGAATASSGSATTAAVPPWAASFK
jgi:hypothetical protein